MMCSYPTHLCLVTARCVGGDGQFFKVKTPGVAPSKLEDFGLDYQSDKAFQSLGGREVIKVTPTHRPNRGLIMTLKGLDPPCQAIISLPLR